MVRLLTLNLWQEQGPWQRRMEAVVRQLRVIAPDLICLQEVRDVPGRVPNQAAQLAQALELEHRFAAAQAWGDGEEGLAILSRWPLTDSAVRELPWQGSATRRVCLAAQVEAPGARRVSVYTTHLAYRPADGQLRCEQVLALDRFVRETAGDGALVLLAGDFNATPDADEVRFLCGLTSLAGARTYYQDAFATRHPGLAGWTWCSENPYTEPLSWLPRDRRLDYVFVGPQTRAGVGRIVDCRIVCDQPEPDGTRCSDHYGLLVDVEP